ncbi:MAG: DUF420 domain-containing protein [Planctomycetota bacterium]
MELTDLPAVNAALNSTSAVLLFIGWRMIRRGRIEAHKRCMIAAFSVSTLFLASYLFYHYHHGSTKFQSEGAIRIVYFAVLLSHTILAVPVAVMAPWTLILGLKDRREKHRKLARWTWPIWMYVSVTGVLVYWMLYHLDAAMRT